MSNPDRAQNENLGVEYFDNLVRPTEEPPITEEDMKNEILKVSDSPFVKAASKTVGIVFCIGVILAILSVVAWIVRWGFGIG
jgi:hypothetical protein